MSTTGDLVRNRIRSVCAGEDFGWVEATSPFDFTQQPNGAIDQCFRVTMTGDKAIGGLNYTEDRTDRIEIWLARKQTATVGETYTQLVSDAADLRAAVIRDGATWGEYSVPDAGAGMAVTHEKGTEYAVLRVALGVNYEVNL